MLFTIYMLSVAFADLPLPIYPECGEPDAEDLCPNDADDWHVISYIPEDQQGNIQESELELGSGNRLDRALRYHTGRFDVSVGIMDSGIDWSHKDLVEKYF